MELTDEETGYDIEALKESVKDCRENLATFNVIVHNPNSSKKDVLVFMKRVNMEQDKIIRYQRIIDELDRRENIQ